MGCILHLHSEWKRFEPTSHFPRALRQRKQIAGMTKPVVFMILRTVIIEKPLLKR
jgi:hypothetical protein